MTRPELPSSIRRVLEILEDACECRSARTTGEWVGNRDMMTKSGTMRFGARLAELKALGFKWECTTKIGGASHHYRLTGYPSDFEGDRVLKAEQQSLSLDS